MTQPFKFRPMPASIFLTLSTVAVSLAVSYFANGNPFGTVGIPTLRGYGGITFEDIGNLELWRLATAQLIHAKQGHMVFNALCLLCLGSLVEDRAGPAKTISLWLVGGGLATLVSPIWTEAPWNVGTGASQAVFAFSGCALVFVLSGRLSRAPGCVLIAIAVLPGLCLDFMTAGYPKPGHAAGLCLGALFGLLAGSKSHKSGS